MKQFLGILLILMSLNLHAQKKLNKSWEVAKVEFEDGRFLDGYIENFMIKRKLKNKRLKIKQSKINDTNFQFKTSMEAKAEVIESKDIKSVQLIEDDVVWHFEKLNIKGLSGNAKPIETTEKVFLLVYDKGQKADIYMRTNGNANRAYEGMIYLKNYQDEFAVPLFDNNLSMFSLITSNKISNDIANSLSWVTRDCPKMKVIIDDEVKRAENREIELTTSANQNFVQGIVGFIETYHQECK